MLHGRQKLARPDVAGRDGVAIQRPLLGLLLIPCFLEWVAWSSDVDGELDGTANQG